MGRRKGKKTQHDAANEVNDFAGLLRRFADRAQLPFTEVADLAGLSFYTLRNWGRGHARPRHWQDVFKLAYVLNLSEAELDLLLRAAGHEPLAELVAVHPLLKERQHWRGDQLPPTTDEGDAEDEQPVPSVADTTLNTPSAPTRRSVIGRTVVLLLLIGLLSAGITYLLMPKRNPAYLSFPPPELNGPAWQLPDRRVDARPAYTTANGLRYFKVGEQVEFSFRIVNTGDQPYALPVLSLVIWGPDGCEGTKARTERTAQLRVIPAMPGEGYTHKELVTFSQPGIYFAEPLYKNVDLKNWHNFQKTELWFFVVDSNGKLPEPQCLADGTPVP